MSDIDPIQQSEPRQHAKPGIRLDRFTVLACLAITALVELICIYARFGLAMESTSATASTIGRITLGIRIHHGYIGAAMIPLGIYWFAGRWSVGWICFVVGVGLLSSDLIHHFLVLWPMTGSPDFDLVYPAP